MEVYDQAMRYYDLSLAEFRSPDVIKRADEVWHLMLNRFAFDSLCGSNGKCFIFIRCLFAKFLAFKLQFYPECTL